MRFVKGLGKREIADILHDIDFPTRDFPTRYPYRENPALILEQFPLLVCDDQDVSIKQPARPFGVLAG